MNCIVCPVISALQCIGFVFVAPGTQFAAGMGTYNGCFGSAGKFT